MKIFLSFILLGGLIVFSMASLPAFREENVEKIFNALKWYGHASFAIEADKVIFIDPWKIPDSAPKADLILVTHSHSDHFSPADIDRLRKEETTVICTPDCVSRLSGNVKAMKPGQELEAHGVRVKAVPAYTPDKPFHPKANNWVGYVLTVDGVSIYHAGDTDFIPEMKELGRVHIALLPVGGQYTMNAEEAARAAGIIKADVSVPMHYGAGVIGSVRDAEKFKELVKGEVRILKEVGK